MLPQLLKLQPILCEQPAKVEWEHQQAGCNPLAAFCEGLTGTGGGTRTRLPLAGWTQPTSPLPRHILRLHSAQQRTGGPLEACSLWRLTQQASSTRLWPHCSLLPTPPCGDPCTFSPAGQQLEWPQACCSRQPGLMRSGKPRPPCSRYAIMRCAGLRPGAISGLVATQGGQAAVTTAAVVAADLPAPPLSCPSSPPHPSPFENRAAVLHSSRGCPSNSCHHLPGWLLRDRGERVRTKGQPGRRRRAGVRGEVSRRSQRTFAPLPSPLPQAAHHPGLGSGSAAAPDAAGEERAGNAACVGVARGCACAACHQHAAEHSINLSDVPSHFRRTCCPT